MLNSLLFIIISILFLMVSKRAFNDYFSPVGIMGAVWFFVLALFHLRLYPFFPLSPFIWSCVLGGLLLFFVGCISALLFNIGGGAALSKDRPFERIDHHRLFKTMLFFWITGLVGFIPLFLRIVMIYGLKAFITKPVEVHDNFTVQFFGYFWLLNVLTPALALIYVQIAKKRRFLITIIIGSSVFTQLCSISRTNAIIALVVMVLSSIYLKTSKYVLRNSIIACISVVVLFSAFQFIKDPTTSKRLQASTFRPEILKPFAPVYGYITAPLPTFEAMVKDTRSYDYGSNTFITIAKFLKLFFPEIKLPPWPGKWYSNPTRCNVYTYLEPYYKDFGIYGIILFCFLQGFLVMFFYLRMNRHGKYNYFLLNGLFAWCLLISFFSNHFKGNSMLFLSVVAIFAGKYIVSKQTPSINVGMKN